MDQGQGIVGLVGHQLIVEGQRLAEAAVLKREIAEQFEGVISPGAAECLIDDPMEQADVPPARALAIPGLRQPIDTPAVELARLGR